MIAKNIDEITEEDLQALIDNAVAESKNALLWHTIGGKMRLQTCLSVNSRNYFSTRGPYR